MKVAAILLLLLSTTLSLTASGQLPDPPQGRTVVLRGARLVDGGGGAPLDDSVIVIRDGRIAAVGPSRGTPTPGDAVEISYRGQTIIPGLVSDHSHVGASALLGLTDRGHLAQGRLADLIVLDADPTVDIANTTKIRAVWHRGKRSAGSLR